MDPVIRVAFVLALSGCVNPWAAPRCSDGIDNDEDALTDLDDPDCAGDPSRDSEDGFDAGRPPDASIDAAIDAAMPFDAGCTPLAPSWACAADVLPRICGGACVDVATDPAHCGACDSPCDGGEVCLYGTCRVCTSLDGAEICEGACVTPHSAPRVCGGCPGEVCAADQTCLEGSCVPADEGRGDRCARPIELAEGTQTIELFVSATLDGAVPRCTPVPLVPRHGAFVDFIAPREGRWRIGVTSAGGGVAIQLLDDEECRCAGALCETGATTAAVETPSAEGIRLRALVVSYSVDTVSADVHVMPTP
jgi:hypothetical protein